jgi:superfamily I DNA and/or RNA helicase
LEDCYRMTPLLVKLTNFFYGGKLRCMRTDVPDEVNRNSLIVIDTKDLPNRNDDPVGTSWWNKQELKIVQEIVHQFATDGNIDSDAIGIITPYGAQVRSLRNELKNWLGRMVRDYRSRIERELTLMKNTGTAWPFQGREKPVIVTSFVRSNPPVEKRGKVVTTTGFMDWKMINVITSRGQECTIVVLDSETFLKSPQKRVPEFVSHMLKLAKEKGVYIELTQEKPMPDLRKSISVLKGHIAKTFKGVLPLIPKKSSNVQESASGAKESHDTIESSI